MASLEAVLAGIPGLGGYHARREMIEDENRHALKEAGAVMQLREAAAQAEEREARRRAALESGGDPDKYMAALARHGLVAPTDMLEYQNRQAKVRQEQDRRAFYSPENRARFIETPSEAPPITHDEEGNVYPQVQGQPRFNMGRFVEEGAARGVIDPEKYMDHLGRREDKQMQIASQVQQARERIQGQIEVARLNGASREQVAEMMMDGRREIAEIAAGTRRDVARIVAANRSPGQVVQTDDGFFRVGANNVGVPIKAPDGENLMPRSRASVGGFKNIESDGKGGFVGFNTKTNRIEAVPMDEAVKTNFAASEAIVDAIKDGRMQLPSGFALKSPYWQNVLERVAQKDPNFDASRYGARAAARRTFASGPEARNVTALNTVIGHLGTLDEMAMSLNNKDVRLQNMVINRLRTELGDPRVQNFDTARQAVAEETMRVFRQVGASEAEARAWGERISSSGSPAQLRGVISTLGELLESRIQAVGQQYERTVNEQGNPARVDPKNQQKLNRMRQPSPTSTSGGASVSNW